jgi:peptide/nickel transport system permease protein
MGLFVVRRLLAAAVLIVVVPSLTYIWFASLYSDAPVFSGLLDYLEATFVHFDLGHARGFNSVDIKTLVRRGVPVDIALMAGAMVVGVGVGMLGGVYLSQRRAGTLSGAMHLVGVVAICAPAAVTAYAIVFFFGAAGGDHPVFFVSDSGIYRPLTEAPLAWVQALWVPWLAVGLPIAGAVMRVTAGATRDALGDDAIRTARAKGVRHRRVMHRHALPFALPPVSAYGGASMNLVILNAAIVEQIFNLPGSFRYAKQAIDNPDLPLLQAMAQVAVVYVVGGNLIADLVAARVDPRIRD